jgi:hypothetical protein
MKPDITLVEETDIVGNFHTPHIRTTEINMPSKKRVARNILTKKEEDILLVNSVAFFGASVFSGISVKNIEYLAKNAPEDYKKNILKVLHDKKMMEEIFQIAKAMDEDLENNATQNQERVRNVVQYISDNRIVFEF